MANTHGTRIKGNFAYWDTHRKRLVDAIGPDVIKFDLEPGDVQPDGATGGDPTGWTMTPVEVGAGTSEFRGSGEAGSVAEILTAANENDGLNAQLGALAFELTSDQVLYFGIEFEINDVTQSDLFLGLAVKDTAILAGVTDRIGFQSVDADAGLDFAIEKNNTETLTEDVHTLVDATKVFCEFYFDGTNIEVFVDGVSVATPAVTNLPDDVPMRLSLEFLTGEAVAQTLKIRRLLVIQIGR